MKPIQLFTEYFNSNVFLSWRSRVFDSKYRSTNCCKADESQLQSDFPEPPARPPHAKCKQLKPKAYISSFVVATLSLTVVMGQRFYNAPKLDVGTIAPETIIAPNNATVEDKKTTEEKRKAALTATEPVLMIDQKTTQSIEEELQMLIGILGDNRQNNKELLPITSTKIISLSAQIDLIKSSDQEWITIRSLVSNNGLQSASDVVSLSPELKSAWSEIQAYQQRVSGKDLAYLMDNIGIARGKYQDLVRNFNSELEGYLVQNPDGYLAQFSPVLILIPSDSDWQKMEWGITQSAHNILTQGIPVGLPSNIVKNAVDAQVTLLVPTKTKELATGILLAVLKPNLIKDAEQTKLKAEQAVNPELVTIKSGEIIVKQGEEINQKQFVLLDHFQLSRRSVNWLGLMGFGGLVGSSLIIFWIVEHRFYGRMRNRDRILILLLCLSTSILYFFNIPYLHLPIVGLLIGSFYGRPMGITIIGLLAILLSFGLAVNWDDLLAATGASLIGASYAEKSRSREELALLGVGMGVTQGCIYLLLNLIPSAAPTLIWYNLLADASLHGLAGLAWSIVAIGLSPYLERLFDIITPIRLVELSNPNGPLLKKLAHEAPGTFQHTLFVASLAEAGARKLGCNVELVRTGTLYHDIGKMHDPLGFIENQMGGPNKHNEINDPWISAEIIKKHVTEGIQMAKRYRLPNAIQSFIPEHQGTMLIAYFYYQAQKIASEHPNQLPREVREEDFRYDGPIPQSRETAIVMLADSCEAALRTLKDHNPQAALAMVKKILKAKWQDNQLVDSCLSREDLDVLAKEFVCVWQQFNHQRIAYPS